MDSTRLKMQSARSSIPGMKHLYSDSGVRRCGFFLVDLLRGWGRGIENQLALEQGESYIFMHLGKRGSVFILKILSFISDVGWSGGEKGAKPHTPITSTFSNKFYFVFKLIYLQKKNKINE